MLPRTLIHIANRHVRFPSARARCATDAKDEETMGANVRKVSAGSDLEPFVPVRLGTLSIEIFATC